VKNTGSSLTADSVLISSGSKAIELEKQAIQEKAVRAAEFEKLKSESAKEGHLYIAGDCQPTGTIATFQILEAGSWRDLLEATEWMSTNICVNSPRSSTAVWKPVVITTLNSYVSYRWKFQYNNQWSLPSYSQISISPQTKADAMAEAKAKAEAEAKKAAASAAAELKAKQEADAKATAELKAKQEADAKATAELKAKQEADANATAELKAKQEADAKATAELKAKQEADAKATAELKAKQEADAKAAAELKAKQEAEVKAAALKKTTITCIKGKLTKKVTAIKPKCPAGYKVKK
jgi:hypothetical protein